jgi:hypothetical protein
MPRTLLPVFAKTCYDITEEPKENFSFLPDDMRYKYEDFRSALDSVPGSREYLMNYVKPEGGSTFYDDIGNQIMSAAGSHHSGASVVALGWQYKNLLNDWNGWVKGAKEHYAKKEYTNLQLERPQTWPFAHALAEKECASLYYDSEAVAKADKKILSVIVELKGSLSLPYEPEEIVSMMTDLVAEFEDEATRAEVARAKEHYESRIEVLEHHDKFPDRWNDFGKGSLKSHLFGSIHGITSGMYETMETRRPGYKQRIQAIIASKN